MHQKRVFAGILMAVPFVIANFYLYGYTNLGLLIMGAFLGICAIVIFYFCRLTGSLTWKSTGWGAVTAILLMLLSQTVWNATQRGLLNADAWADSIRGDALPIFVQATAMLFVLLLAPVVILPTRPE